MLRIATVAAFAALIAAPASAEAIHVSTAGKSAEQVRVEIQKAAKLVCRREYLGTASLPGSYSACLTASTRKAVTQLGEGQELAAR